MILKQEHRGYIMMMQQKGDCLHLTAMHFAVSGTFNPIGSGALVALRLGQGVNIYTALFFS